AVAAEIGGLAGARIQQDAGQCGNRAVARNSQLSPVHFWSPLKLPCCLGASSLGPPRNAPVSGSRRTQPRARAVNRTRKRVGRDSRLTREPWALCGLCGLQWTMAPALPAGPAAGAVLG